MGDFLQMNRTQLLRFLGLPGWCESLAEESPNVRSREVVDDSQVDQNTDSAEEVPESYLNYGVDDRQGENHDSHVHAQPFPESAPQPSANQKMPTSTEKTPSEARTVATLLVVTYATS